jgi:hypothetical protein
MLAFFNGHHLTVHLFQWSFIYKGERESNSPCLLSLLRDRNDWFLSEVSRVTSSKQKQNLQREPLLEFFNAAVTQVLYVVKHYTNFRVSSGLTNLHRGSVNNERMHVTFELANVSLCNSNKMMNKIHDSSPALPG